MDEYRRICFQTSARNYEILRETAEEQGLDLESLTEKIVSDYIDKLHPEIKNKEERREFLRNRADFPVVVQIHFDQRETHYRTGTILDISMGGVRISLPKHERLDVDLVQNVSGMEILFRMPEENHTVSFKCEPRRVQAKDQEVHLGAIFTETDLRSQQVLHKYVM